jgi:diacylglycerol kinase (ATP)
MSENKIEVEESPTVVTPSHPPTFDDESRQEIQVVRSSVKPLMKYKFDPQQPDASTPEVVSGREMSWKVAENLFVSFKHAWAGVSYTFTTQRNFRIHVAIGSLAIGLSLFLQLAAVKVAAIGLTIGLVLSFELLNTAIESVVDLTIERNYHPLAKLAKDCAAGAVLISAMASILVAGVLILPPLFAAILG